jgi:cytochrome P450
LPDALTIEGQLNPFPWYAEMRSRTPVSRDPRGYSWNVFRYDDVQRVLSDYATFSSEYGGSRRDPAQPFAASLINTDPPRHRQLRALVTQAFTPRAVDALAPRIAAIVDELLDKVPTGQMELVADLAAPLPVTVIAELLGIPGEDRARFKRWSDAVVSNAGSSGQDGSAWREMGHYFMQMIEQRRRQPGSDLLSGLLAAEIEGERLSMQELMGFGTLLLVAGNETTTNLLGNALLTFAEEPAVWQRLRAEPALLVGAIEDVLRYRSPVQSMFRVTKTDADLSGQTVPAGSFVVAWIGSANRDEAQFAAPDRYDPERAPNRHLAFGQGIHFCLGAPLARLEARIALQAMLARYPRITLAPGANLQRMPSTIVYGLRALPLNMS